MRLDVFMLAEAAVTREGKLYIHGGGVTEIDAPILPWTHPQLAIVVRLVFTRQEAAEKHQLYLGIAGPNGEEILPRHPFAVPLGEPVDPDVTEAYADLTLTLSPITFATAGHHIVRVELDDLVLREVPLSVVHRAGDYSFMSR